MLHLLVGTYVSTHQARYDELLTCLQKNIANPHIECIHAFKEDDRSCSLGRRHTELLQHPKCRVMDPAKRMTYKTYFEYANRHLAGQCCVMANSDIYFDETLELITPAVLENRFLACSRSHVLPNGDVEFDRMASCAQDAWFFRAPIRIPDDQELPKHEGKVVEGCDFRFGIPGCDNKIVFLMAAVSKYRVVNPSCTVHLFHHHASNVAAYGPKVPGPHWHVAPADLPKEK